MYNKVKFLMPRKVKWSWAMDISKLRLQTEKREKSLIGILTLYLHRLGAWPEVWHAVWMSVFRNHWEALSFLKIDKYIQWALSYLCREIILDKPKILFQNKIRCIIPLETSFSEAPLQTRWPWLYYSLRYLTIDVGWIVLCGQK